MTQISAAPTFLTPADFLAHWLSHRRLTRRVIEAFPEDHLFTSTAAPPMRPFGEMAWEIQGVTAYTLNGDWSRATGRTGLGQPARPGQEGAAGRLG